MSLKRGDQITPILRPVSYAGGHIPPLKLEDSRVRPVSHLSTTERKIQPKLNLEAQPITVKYENVIFTDTSNTGDNTEPQRYDATTTLSGRTTEQRRGKQPVSGISFLNVLPEEEVSETDEFVFTKAHSPNIIAYEIFLKECRFRDDPLHANLLFPKDDIQVPDYLYWHLSVL